MGSLEEEKLFQMEVLSSGNDAETEVLEKVLKHMRKKMDAKKSASSFKEWLVMRLNLDGYDASLCQTSWLITLDCPAGDYEHVGIVNEDKKCVDSLRLIVDIDFKSQYELARPTAAYKKLSETLPPVFVGTHINLTRSFPSFAQLLSNLLGTEESTCRLHGEPSLTCSPNGCLIK